MPALLATSESAQARRLAGLITGLVAGLLLAGCGTAEALRLGSSPPEPPLPVAPDPNIAEATPLPLLVGDSLNDARLAARTASSSSASSSATT